MGGVEEVVLVTVVCVVVVVGVMRCVDVCVYLSVCGWVCMGTDRSLRL